ncbi:putative secreted protein (Por secretion system target) [Flavobacteriaceae bacterium MAR_2010_105]|nr:putative secreted protein (Por secretion system target) [Flavobacteriaceae bacterium MAR_2010_105]
MKTKIQILLLLIGVIGFAQQQTFNLTFEDVTVGSNPAYWNVFEGDTPSVEVVTNPDPDGVNNNASTKVLKLSVLQSNACYAGAETQHATIGKWFLEAPVTTNLSMMVNKSAIGRIGVKFVNATNGTIFELTSQTNTLTNEWELMSWDISSFIASGENNNIDQLVIFSDFTCGDPNRTGDIVTYVDNISWGANKTANPVIPTCNDGIQNGDEAGVDCGGSSCAACPNFPFDFESAQPFVGADGATFSIESDGGNMVGQLANVNSQLYSNAQIVTEALDFTGGIKGFSMKVKGPRAVPVLFKMEKSGTPATFKENSQNYTTPGSWQTLIFDFSGETSNGVLNKFVLFFDITAASTGSDTFQFDDIVFGELASLSTRDVTLSKFKVFPNPSGTEWIIKSQQMTINNIIVYDALGKEVMSLVTNSSEVNINSSTLPSGLYFATVSTNLGTESLRLIKN